MMDWSPYLEKGEALRWEGRPAPRCYTFRNWKHALFGFFLLFLTGSWQVMSFGIGREYALSWMPLLPLPFLLAALYLSAGQLILTRLEWEKVFFAVTDRRIITVGGLLRPKVETLPLCDLTYFRVKFTTETLGSLQLHAAVTGKNLVLSCLEHPRIVTPLLEEAVSRNTTSGVE